MADAPDSDSGALGMGVQVPPRAPFCTKIFQARVAQTVEAALSNCARSQFESEHGHQDYCAAGGKVDARHLKRLGRSMQVRVLRRAPDQSTHAPVAKRSKAPRLHRGISLVRIRPGVPVRRSWHDAQSDHVTANTRLRLPAKTLGCGPGKAGAAPAVGTIVVLRVIAALFRNGRDRRFNRAKK